MANGNAVETNHSHSFTVDDSKNGNYSDQRFDLGSDGIYSANPKPALEEVTHPETGAIIPLDGKLMASVLLNKEAKVALCKGNKGIKVQYPPTDQEIAEGADPNTPVTVAFVNKSGNLKMTMSEWAVIKKNAKKSCTKAVINKKSINNRFGTQFSKLIG